MSTRVIDRRRPVAAVTHVRPLGRVLLYLIACVGLVIWMVGEFA